MVADDVVFCKGGGCTAKLGSAVLEAVLAKLPQQDDPNCLVGFATSDDAAVYRLTDDLAMVQTLDFFPPMVEDPYTFGQIAAANALSDIYAMGAEVKTALNIVCFPETMDLNILGQILLGGQSKVTESGGVLAGGHSIQDVDVKYGLSVTGIIHPDKILTNVGSQVGDVLILTKPLGVGIINTAQTVGEASAAAVAKAIASMTTLNQAAAAVMHSFEVHACTDVTGFGFLGHLHEMLDDRLSVEVDAAAVPVLAEALDLADEFMLTAAAQRNRNHLEPFVQFDGVPFAVEEVLLDPQTSGGLLFSVPEAQASAVLAALEQLDLPSGLVGRVTKRQAWEIVVR